MSRLRGSLAAGELSTVRLISSVHTLTRFNMAKKTPTTASTGLTRRKPPDKSVVAPKNGKPQTVASRLPASSAAQIEAAKQKYEQGIIARGEAAEAGKPLPPGATHEITGHRPDGSPILKRKRFSAS
jgi:hypothetical protein